MIPARELPMTAMVSVSVQSGLDPAASGLLQAARARESASPTKRQWLELAIGALVIAGMAVLAGVAHSARPLHLFSALTLFVAYGLATRAYFEVGSGLALPTQLIFVPMLFLLPLELVPLFVAAGLAVGKLPEVVRRQAPWWTPVTRAESSLYSLAPVGILFAFGQPAPGPSNWWILALAVAGQFACDATLALGREWIAYRVPPRELVRPLLWTFAIDTALVPVGLTTALAARETEAAAVLPVSLLGLIAVFARERRHRLDHALELSAAYRGTALMLGDLIEENDGYTGSHSREVVDLVLTVADELQLDPISRQRAELAALLHDIGKMRVRDSIINKPGPLTPEEWAFIKAHTIEGERILRPIGGLLADVGRVVRSTHERIDGGGYPDGLKGQEIPLEARIIHCCDAYNAMTTSRAYRPAMSHAEAELELLNGAGSQFDRDVVTALLHVLDSRSSR